MNIKLIKTDNFYKDKYIELDGEIVSVDYAIQIWPNKKEQILNQVNSENTKTVNKDIINYPTMKQMLKEIDNKVKHIFKKAKIYKPKNEDEKQIQSALLFNYVSKNFNWDQRVNEEYEQDRVAYKLLMEKEKTLKGKINKISTDIISNLTKEENAKAKKNLNLMHESQMKYYFHCKKNLGEIDSQLYKKQYQQKIDYYKKCMKKAFGEVKDKTLNELKKLENSYKDAYEKRIAEYYNSDNLYAVKQVYNSIVLKRGVCSQLAFGYSHLLNKLGIENYLVHVASENLSYTHMMNAVADKQKDLLYLSDLTKATGYRSYYLNSNQFNKANLNLKGFAIKKHELKRNNNFYVKGIKKLNQLKAEKQENKFTSFTMHGDNKEQMKDFEETLQEEPKFSAVKKGAVHILQMEQ
jgi:hypothetical protein